MAHDKPYDEQREERIERALAAYQKGGISFGAAAEMAGVSRTELARAAHERGMFAPYDEAMLGEELRGLGEG